MKAEKERTETEGPQLIAGSSHVNVTSKYVQSVLVDDSSVTSSSFRKWSDTV